VEEALSLWEERELAWPPIHQHHPDGAPLSAASRSRPQ
jgi:hypothetical protein